MEKELEKIYLKRMDGIANMIGADLDMFRPDQNDQRFFQLCLELGIIGIHFTDSHEDSDFVGKGVYSYDCFLAIRADASGKTEGMFFKYSCNPDRGGFNMKDMLYSLVSDYRLTRETSDMGEFLSEFGYLDGREGRDRLDEYLKGVEIYNQLFHFDKADFEHIFTQREIEKLEEYLDKFYYGDYDDENEQNGNEQNENN